MDDERIIQQRIRGKSIRAIAKSEGVSVGDVHRVLDAWAAHTINDKLRKTTLSLELCRLDEIQEVFYEQALHGDIAAGQLCAKIIEGRSQMLGSHAPQQAILEIVETSAPRQTSTDKLEAVLAELEAMSEEEVEAQLKRIEGSPSTH